ncbi:MAG: hypothetical protein Q9208_003869 [Pyrenodesmia sp. 3 TL-2023]
MIVLRVLRYLTLLLLNISPATSATPSAPDAQIGQVRLPINTPDGRAGSPVKVHLANQTLSGGRAVACFKQREKQEERLWWINVMDCYSSMARGLLLGDDVMLRKDWTEPGRPYSWNAGSCMIILDQKGNVAPGIQEAEIAHVASVITRICVLKSMEGEPLGGQASIGIGNAYSVTVWGRDYGGTLGLAEA